MDVITCSWSLVNTACYNLLLGNFLDDKRYLESASSCQPNNLSSPWQYLKLHGPTNIRRIEIRSLAFILFTEQFQFLRNNTLVTMTVMWNPVTPPTRCRSYIPWRSQISTFRLYIRRPTSQKVEILKADALTGSHPYHGTVHKICIYTDRRTTGI